MTGPLDRFDPAAIDGDARLSQAGQGDPLRAPREVQTAASAAGTTRPTEGFEDRVMAAIALEPAPRVVIRPGSSVRGGRPAAFLLAVRDAWGIATSGGRPATVRAQAIAFVLLVAVAAGTLGTAGVVGVGALLRPDQ